MQDSAFHFEKNPDFFQNNLGFLIGRVHRLLKHRWELSLKEIELTPSQAGLLSLVAKKPGISLRKAGRELANDPTNSHRIVLDLESKQLLQRYKDPKDKRLVCMKLTPLGLAKFEQIQILAKKNQEKLLDQIGQPNQQKLMDLLLEVQKDLEKNE